VTEKDIHKIIDRLLKLPKECEWAEFKMNLKTEEEIGKNLSALSNGASLHNEAFGYLVFGIEDETLKPSGTTFRPKMHKVGNEELEHWLLQRLSPRMDLAIYEIEIDGKMLAVFQIQAAHSQPTCFSNIDYVRVGSITRSLKDFPEKEKKIWAKGPKQYFEKAISYLAETAEEVVALLDTQSYFDLLKIPYPSTRTGVIERLEKEKFIKQHTNGYAITNLGAMLFAKDMNFFDSLKRKAPRVIQYEGKNKLKLLKDQTGKLGYAAGFERLIIYITSLLPGNEVIGQALRSSVTMYPQIAIRELVANMLIHQDFNERGTGPVIEIYEDRIEISNPGVPLITPNRFIDEYQCRNEDLAGAMRRFGICEELGSGIDKVIFNIEMYQLPALDVQIQEKHTKVILYAYKKFGDMDKSDRIRACYQHTCLKYVTNEKMTNQTLRQRFKIADENAAMVSRMIKDTVDAGMIKEDDPENKSREICEVIPAWA